MWLSIYYFMRSEDGYKQIPLDSFSFCGLRSRAITEFIGRYLHRPNSWPPEIEQLLWPENKDAPLPNGWQYLTWIPYDMPWGGFDNTQMLKEREERLQKQAG